LRATAALDRADPEEVELGLPGEVAERVVELRRRVEMVRCDRLKA
jgi:hypothetical protein